MTVSDRSGAALLLVDMQHDFMPGGALEVAEGDLIVEPVRRLLETRAYGCVVATQDWHPPGHISFASRHTGREPFETIELYGHEQVLWPDHCVQGSAGAAFHEGLPLESADAIIRKGADPKVDSYSGFRNNWDAHGNRPTTGLAGYLRERGITGVHICGLARDVCVRWTAEDAAELGFETTMIWDLTRAVDPGTDRDVEAALARSGVRITTAHALT